MNGKQFKTRPNPALALFIIVLAGVVQIHGSWAALTNPYIINDDVRNTIYWMQQFRDPELFQDDPLTAFFKNFLPWGFTAFYYVLSFVWDPMVVSKILPTFLFVISSYYLFRLVRSFSDDFTAVVAALSFILMPVFLDSMAGGLPHSFGFLWIIVFLYYLVRRDFFKVWFVLVLQSLTYQMVFPPCLGVFALTLFKLGRDGLTVDREDKKLKYLFLSFLIPGILLIVRYMVFDDPQIGSVVTRQDMLGHPEYYAQGRHPVLPTTPLFEELIFQFYRGGMMTHIVGRLGQYGASVDLMKIIFWSSSFVLVVFPLIQCLRKRMIIPRELFYLAFTSIVMYKLSDMMLLKLYIPTRYVEYSIPLIMLVIQALGVGALLQMIKRSSLRKLISMTLIVLIILGGNYQSLGYLDLSRLRDFYQAVQQLPKESLVAAHPWLADGIPAFAQRKVFVAYELSYPFYDKHWVMIKQRTYDFFNAYYAEDIKSVDAFCRKYGIDYVVVNKLDFTKWNLDRKDFYFEPFNAYIVDLAQKCGHFVLPEIPDEDKIFQTGNIFIVDAAVFREGY